AMGRRAVHRKRGGVFGAARRLSELGGYTLRQALIGDVVLHMIVKLIPFGILAAVVGALAAPFALDGMSLGPVLAGIVILIYIVHSIVFLTAVARIRLRRARRYRLCERALLDVLQNAIHSETPVSPTRWEALEIARWAAWVRIERGRSIWFRMTRPGRP
ncbi:MAG: hypothetical protein U9N14_03670, partial [Pseudomonadota bacterium]|nr:hypothetical protein [Pseudomonadota bacterium]